MSAVFDPMDYDYFLPEELIAQEPPARRGTSRLMVLDCAGGAPVHSGFSELLSFLRPGDLLVFNDSRVIPARVFGRKEPGGARLEFLFLEERAGGWLCLVRPGKRVSAGTRVIVGEDPCAEAEITAVCGGGEFELSFSALPEGGLSALLDESGFMPLPPYIKRDYRHPDPERRRLDNERYQTVFSSAPGSSAAPTAGLHFTRGLLESAAAAGVESAFVTLHVGLGTFLPLRPENIESGRLHSERFSVGGQTAEAVMRARAEGRRVIAVGTTSARVLEAVWARYGKIKACSETTDIFIRPPYGFGATDAMITNFHIPRSSLLMLVSALAGRERILAAYTEAVRRGYRFFSYGDAMLIL